MSAKRRERGEVRARPAAPGAPAAARAAAPASSTTAPPDPQLPPRRGGRLVERVLLIAAALAVVAFYASARAGAPAPWSYDEYYHLGVARELASHFPLRTFPWTPFSILSEHFADKEPLFHFLLLPFARLPLERAGLAGVLVCQLFFVAAFSWVVWRLRVPHAYAFVLGLTLLGSMFAMRVDMCRPHLLLMAFSVLVVGLLVLSHDPEAPGEAAASAAPAGRKPWLSTGRKPWLSTVAPWGKGPLFGLWGLVAVSALFSLAHAGAWIAVFYAAVWGIAGWLVPAGRTGGHAGRRRFLWQPLACTAGGWLLGQLIHPNLPYNLRLVALVNVLVPFEASAAGNAALRSQIGEELTPPGLAILAEQWTVFLAPLFAAILLLRRPRLRTRATLAAALIALSFLLAGSLFLRRMLELAAPLGMLALAVVFATGARQRSEAQEGARMDALKAPKRGDARHAGATLSRRERRQLSAAALPGAAPLLAGWGPWIFPFVLAIGALWTAATVRSHGLGQVSQPQQMAVWLGEHGRPGERVFTAQWADSAPLFYSAPQLQSLVALDPTLFYAKDAARFQEYVDIVLGRLADPATAIRRDFGARWVTIWLYPDYQRLARQLLSAPAPAAGRRPAPPAQLVYQDPYYLVLDLGRP
jgi:hypothetical protein